MYNSSSDHDTEDWVEIYNPLSIPKISRIGYSEMIIIIIFLIFLSIPILIPNSVSSFVEIRLRLRYSMATLAVSLVI